MGTFGAQRLRRQSISSKRTRQSVKAIETSSVAIGGNTCDNKALNISASKDWETIMRSLINLRTVIIILKSTRCFYAMACVVHMNLLCEQYTT